MRERPGCPHTLSIRPAIVIYSSWLPAAAIRKVYHRQLLHGDVRHANRIYSTVPALRIAGQETISLVTDRQP